MNPQGPQAQRSEGEIGTSAEWSVERSAESAAALPAADGASQRGGVTTLLDRAMVQAAASRLGFERDAVMIDLHVTFVHAAFIAPGRLIARARVCGGGKSTCFCEAEVIDGDGQVAARAMGTLRYATAVNRVAEGPLG